MDAPSMDAMQTTTWIGNMSACVILLLHDLSMAVPPKSNVSELPEHLPDPAIPANYPTSCTRPTSHTRHSTLTPRQKKKNKEREETGLFCDCHMLHYPPPT